MCGKEAMIQVNVTFCGHSKINRTESFSKWLDMILPSFIEGGAATVPLTVWLLRRYGS